MQKMKQKITKKQNILTSIKDNLKSILIALAIALLIRSFLIQAFVIPSGSMKPTLLEGDYIFVTKFSYGYSKHSLPFSLPLIPSRIFYTVPKRGDVVVFKVPSDNSTDYIKRIIGLPGDKVELINSVVYVNNLPIIKEQIGTTKDMPNYTLNVYKENIKENHYNKTFFTWGFPQGINKLDYISAFYVPKDMFFVMGDNRHFSKDSRFQEVGFIPKENLVGKAQIIFFSIEGYFLEFWKWFTEIRFWRIFKIIK